MQAASCSKTDLLKSRAGAMLGLAVVLAGCARHIAVVRPVPPDKAAELNDLLSDREAKLTLEGKPGTVNAKDVRIGAVNVRYLESDPPTSTSRRVNWRPEAQAPLAAVRHVEFRQHGRGALNGLGIGFATGVGLGAAIGLAVQPNCNDCFHGDAVVGLAAAGGAVAFGLLGAIIGGIVGAPTTIDFTDASATDPLPAQQH